MYKGTIAQGELPTPSQVEIKGMSQPHLIPNCFGTGMSTSEESVMSAIYSLAVGAGGWGPFFYDTVLDLAIWYLADHDLVIRALDYPLLESKAKEILELFAMQYDFIYLMNWQGAEYVVPRDGLALLSQSIEPYWEPMPPTILQ